MNGIGSEIEIQLLSKETLKESLKLLDSVFGDDPEDKFTYTRAFNASLGDKKYLEMYKGMTPEHLQYYVAVHEKTREVVGTTGLYAYENDIKENIFWVGWFCVDPKYRGKKIGSMLLDFTIQKARDAHKAGLKLWTTTSPKWDSAQILYKRRGFVVTEKEKARGQYEKVYMELRF